MSERPVIFNDAMSLAIIEGRKTVTRRPFPLKHQAHSGGVVYDQWSGIAELVADGPSKSLKLWMDGAHLPPASFSCHMPRWASRTTLDVLGVRVGRLQSMTETDAHAEGFATLADFIATWDAIYPAMPWASNPWAWVIEFKR